MKNLKISRTEIVKLAAKNMCLYRYNYWYLGIVSLAPIFLLILAFSTPQLPSVFMLWTMLLILAIPTIYAIRIIVDEFVITAAIASFRHGKGAIWLVDNQLHFFDRTISIDQVSYLIRKSKYGFGDFELHMTNGQEISYPSAFVMACF